MQGEGVFDCDNFTVTLPAVTTEVQRPKAGCGTEDGGLGLSLHAALCGLFPQGGWDEIISWLHSSSEALDTQTKSRLEHPGSASPVPTRPEFPSSACSEGSFSLPLLSRAGRDATWS